MEPTAGREGWPFGSRSDHDERAFWSTGHLSAEEDADPWSTGHFSEVDIEIKKWISSTC